MTEHVSLLRYYRHACLRSLWLVFDLLPWPLQAVWALMQWSMREAHKHHLIDWRWNEGRRHRCQLVRRCEGKLWRRVTMLATPLDDQRIGFSQWEETEREESNNGIPELPAGRTAGSLWDQQPLRLPRLNLELSWGGLLRAPFIIHQLKKDPVQFLPSAVSRLRVYLQSRHNEGTLKRNASNKPRNQWIKHTYICVFAWTKLSTQTHPNAFISHTHTHTLFVNW